MKKLYFLGLAAVLTLGLASCGGEPAPQFTEEEYQTAVDKVSKMGIATLNGNDALVPNFEQTLIGNANDRIVVELKHSYVIKGKGAVEVSIAWDYDKEQANAKCISGFKDIKDGEGNVSDSLKNLYFNYPAGEGAVDAENVSFYAVCSAGGKTARSDFKVKLTVKTIEFEKMSLAEFYEVQSNNLFKWNNADGTIGSNSEVKSGGKLQYYVEVACKVVYVAADENFAIGADGSRYIYLYKMGDYHPQVGHYYAFGGQIATYYGNVQLSFISYMTEQADHSAIAEPVMDNVVTLAEIKAFSMVSDKHMYSVKLENVELKEAANIAFGARGTFVIKQGDLELTVAYDYHTGTVNKKEPTEDFTAWNNILSSLKVGDKFSIKGNLIYSHPSDSAPKYTASGHDWSLMPAISGSAIVKA